jgi:hypothetical protein
MMRFFCAPCQGLLAAHIRRTYFSPMETVGRYSIWGSPQLINLR